MNFLPLCTASVCPTISGTTVDRRDHVLMTFLSAPRFISSTFSRRCVSTNGPFLSERPIVNLQSAIDLFSSPLDDEPVGPLAIPRLVALCREPPRRHRMPAAGRLAFSAAERMVDRVHRDTPHVRPLAEPAAPTSLADRHVLVIEVADLTDGGEALHENLANLPRRHLDRRVVAFLRDQLHR